jgi:spermidine/putrescine transport system substrate-binding protein
VDAYGTRVETADLGRELHLFTWPDYLDPRLVEEFENAYGVTVVIDYYDTNEAMIAKLQAGGTGQYDLVVASDYAVEVLEGAQLLQPLDHAAIPNLKNLAARFRDAPYDPGNVYSAAYQWGTSGLGVRPDLAADPTRIEPTWRLVFDSATAVGPFTMLNDARETIGAALIYLGHSPNTTDEGELAEAERLLMAQRRRLLTYAPFATSRDLLASGDAVVTHGFSGDVLQVADEVPSVRYLIPREGAIVWTDNLAIPTGAPDPRLAALFVNFILDAQVGARLSDFTRFATPNDASLPLVGAELRADPAVYPDSAVMSRLEFLRDLGAARAAYDRIWTRLRAGAEGG